MTGGPVRLLCVGDAFFDRPAGMGDLSELRALLATGDIVFGNCEGNYSASPERSPHARGPQIAAPARLAPLAELGFTVMSVANNHIVEVPKRPWHLARRPSWASERLGRCEPGRRGEPAVLERAGSGRDRRGVLGVSGGYEARPGVAGLLPLRAHTFYLNPTPDDWNPGVQPTVITAIDDDDSSVLEAAVSAAREQATW